MGKSLILTEEITVKAPKWAHASFEHNLMSFMKHNELPNSLNPLNDHSLFENAPVLHEGWVYPEKHLYNRVNPRREAPMDNLTHHAKMQFILSAVPFDKNNPICLDRHGRILDGSYRLYAVGELNENRRIGAKKRVYVRMYDFE